MRIAWFSPLPPNRSGIAAYCAELLPRLTGHDIEAFVDGGEGRDGPARVARLEGVAVCGAHEFPWRHARLPYDVIVYHVGNDTSHDYLWPYMVRYHGLVVLHDGQLHQARANALIRQRREDDFKAEFAYCFPEAPPAAADIVVAGLGATLCYLWPMVHVPVEAARVVAVHNRWLARELGAQFPGARIRRIRMGVADSLAGVRVPASEIRARHGIPDGAVVFASFGRVTPEKGLSAVLRVLAQVAPSLPALRLLTVGGPAGHYDLMAEAREQGVADRVVEAGYVADEDLASYLNAVDACLNLRWPTGRETSAAWLRCAAAGKPTIVTDLAHTTDVPSLDLRSMATACTLPGAHEPVCVHVALDDEVNMLRLALRKLTEDAGLRARLGGAARRYWGAEGTIELMARDYEDTLTAARMTAGPARPARWPAHLRADGTATARRLAAEVGVPFPLDLPADARSRMTPALTRTDRAPDGARRR
jgi:glycosyltransferase involved in cell wall biosynthesis